MHRLPLLAACALFGATLPTPARAAEPLTAQAFEHTITRQIGYKFLLGLPEGYRRDGEKRWPLLLFLHGAGERGDDLWSVAKHGPPKILRQGAPEPIAAVLRANFIVVSPQCPKDQWWDPEAVVALLDDVMAKHAVDPTRVYLAGLSMGGFGTWQIGLTLPERFAAIVPICGGGSWVNVRASLGNKRDALRSLPVWAFHGAKDETVPLAESERMVELLQKARVAEVKLTVYPEAKHDSWTETFANPELYRWLLSHRRAATGPAAAAK